MPRPKKDLILTKQMCSRFIAITDFLDRSEIQISKELGYANQTTLTKVRKGESFVDAEKLHRLATIPINPNIVANIHWIITGSGNPFTTLANGTSDLSQTLSIALLSTLINKD